ncbi:MAG: FtsX-like permease family protein, partial [bacterium]|nr:FtsX-like permease family protein [bacterium]
HTRKVFKYGDKAFYESGGVIADPAIFSVFTFPFKEGNPDGAFSDPFNIVITEEFGEKYFDDESPLGKIMEVDGIQVTVTGVIENIPNNSHLSFDYMSSFEFIRRLSGYGTSWGSFNFITYAHLLPNADIAVVNEKMLEVAKTNNCSQVVRSNWGISLQTLSDAYLSGHISHGTGQVGNSNIVYAFSIIAVFILLIACVNFMNLSTARSSDRAREVGMRKTVGALRSQIIRQFFGESFIIVVIASIISFILILFALPFFNDLAGKELSLDFLNITHMMGIIAIVLITGLLSGCYPALFLSRFMP